MSAPIAQLDDEWETFASFSNVSEITQNNVLENTIGLTVIEDHINQNTVCNENCESLNDLSEPTIVSYQSMEDLVHTFDEKLAACFRLNTVNASVVEESVEATVLSEDYLWKRLTDNYGLVQPLNWETSQIRKLHIPALSLPFSKNKPNQSDNNANRSQQCDLNEEELQNQMDYHRLIEYNVYTDKETSLFYNTSLHEGNRVTMQTADEVIEELEGIMQDAADVNAAEDYEIQQETGIIFDENSLEGDLDEEFSNVEYRPYIGSPSSQEESDRASDLKNLSLSELNAINEGLDEQVKLLSAQLLEELNSRDELHCEYEVKNTFISKVMEVQYKREQLSRTITTLPLSRKLGLLRRSSTSDSLAREGRFLTTVIPCNKGDKVTLDTLVALIKILDAIKADSEEVPTLLTSYILKVLCPAADNLSLKL